MLALLWLVAAVPAAAAAETDNSGVSSMLEEESPDAFLAKATLQQYLSRVVRKDWEGARRLTHPKTLGVIEQVKKRAGSERHNLAPWANRDVQLKTFRFTGTRQVAPGVVLVQVGEDTYRTEEQGMSVDDAAVYLLFKSRPRQGAKRRCMRGATASGALRRQCRRRVHAPWRCRPRTSTPSRACR